MKETKVYNSFFEAVDAIGPFNGESHNNESKRIVFHDWPTIDEVYGAKRKWLVIKDKK